MPRHGQRYNSKGSNIILYHLKAQNRTISDIKRLLDIGRTQLADKIKNPSHFTLEELYMIAGYFRADVIEFMCCIYLNSVKVPKEIKHDLSSILSEIKASE